MLDQILEADLDVLNGTGDSDVARHLRECERCHAVASQIIGDTRSLALAVFDTRACIKMAPPPAAAPALVRSRRHFGRAAIGVGLAAALCLVVVREWQRRDAVPNNPSRVASVEPRRSDPLDRSLSPATVVASPPPSLRRVRPVSRRPAAAGIREAQPLLGRTTPRVLATVAERTIVEPVGLPTAVAPVRLDTTTVALGGGVAVDPPTGTRANIIRTPNPTVTVVWLYQ